MKSRVVPLLLLITLFACPPAAASAQAQTSVRKPGAARARGGTPARRPADKDPLDNYGSIAGASRGHPTRPSEK